MKDKIRVVIVDDEPLARKGLIIRLSDIAAVEVVGECSNGREAVAMIPALNPDLVFLDIQMPGLNGFQVVNTLTEQQLHLPLIVFVTAYDSYAIKAFEIHALDYLMKPVDESRLLDAVEKAQQALVAQQGEQQKQHLATLLADFTGDNSEDVLRKLASGELVKETAHASVLVIKDGSEIKRVDMSHIQWIDAAGDYMCVHTDNDTHIMRKTMKELLDELDPRLFIRVHRSVIVNIQYVAKLVSHISGEYHLVLHNGTELKVSRSHRDKVKQMMVEM